MTTENQGTVLCPHCRGEIKAAARACKHCKRMVGGAAKDATSGPAGATTTSVLDDLRSFLVSRGVINAVQFDARLAGESTVDAVVLLGHLAASGYIAPAQIEGLREGFRQQQGSRAVAMLHLARDRGLLTPAQVEQALANYQGVLFEQTLAEYVISAGLLTAAQAAELQRSASLTGSLVVGVRAWWDRLSKTGRRVVYALVGVSVVWLVWVVIWLAVDAIRGHADIVEDPTMNGYGLGTSTFTNRGRRAGSICGHVYVSCGRGSRSSASFCSGSVGPNETKQVEFSVPGMDRIRPYGRDWRDDCRFAFVRESRGD